MLPISPESYDFRSPTTSAALVPRAGLKILWSCEVDERERGSVQKPHVDLTSLLLLLFAREGAGMLLA